MATRWPLLVALPSMLILGPARAQDGVLELPRGGPWTLFNPVPAELMRPMSTDRPDTTESPYTVDAGHVQVEMSAVEFGRDRGAESFSFAPINFKIGVLTNLDLQFLFEPHVREAGETGSLRGTGGTGVRAKFNLWGNDGGRTALALMPFVLFPSGDHDVSPSEVEFGLVVPLAIELTDRLGLGLMGEFDALADDDGDHQFGFVHTAVLGLDVTERIGVFVEFIGEVRTGDFSGYAASASGGGTLALTPNVQLDAGFTAGLTSAADDLGVFAGMSLRF